MYWWLCFPVEWEPVHHTRLQSKIAHHHHHPDNFNLIIHSKIAHPLRYLCPGLHDLLYIGSISWFCFHNSTIHIEPYLPRSYSWISFFSCLYTHKKKVEGWALLISFLLLSITPHFQISINELKLRDQIFDAGALGNFSLAGFEMVRWIECNFEM